MNRGGQHSGRRWGLDLLGFDRGCARRRERGRYHEGSWLEVLEDRRLLATTTNSIENLTGLSISAVHGVPTTQDIATFQSADSSAIPSDFTATINWGDGTATTAGTITEDASDVFHVSGAHDYMGGGSFTPVVTIADTSGIVAATGAFYQTNLVSSVSGNAAIQDTSLINPWGLYASSYTWVSDEGSGLATVYDLPRLRPQSTIVTIPSGQPTGVLYNSDPQGFDVAPSTPAQFLFATLGGTIAGWASGGSATTLATVAGAELTGLASGGVTTGSTVLTTTPYLYATDFTGTTGAHGIDVFDASFNSVTGPGGAFNGKFFDPNLPAGFEPFNIFGQFGNPQILLVAYARPGGSGSLTGAGGYIDEFDTSGNLIKTIVSDPAGSDLNGPWGMVTAPPQGFGPFNNDLLVANFGAGSGTAPAGTITAINPTTDTVAGTIDGATGSPLINPGLWGLLSNWQDLPGISHLPLSLDSLYLSAGIDSQTEGLLAQVWFAPAASATIDNTGSVSQAALTLTGKLNPASASRVANTQEITDVVRPDFIGTASQPDATISLYATSAGSTTPMLIGTGSSDASGAWNITTNQSLADGSYAITAVAADSSGQTFSSSTTVVPDLVIDTVGPKVTGVSVDRKRGRIVVTFEDFGGFNNTGVGLDMASVVDAANYQLVAAHDRRVQAYRMTVASVKPGTTAGTQTVTLRVKGRTNFHAGPYSLKIDSASPADPSGIQDNAGNALDGAFSGTFPSGSGVPGGDFVARLSAIVSTRPGAARIAALLSPTKSVLKDSRPIPS
jgi:uncharacterized protein (TIGR03118 family)